MAIPTNLDIAAVSYNGTNIPLAGGSPTLQTKNKTYTPSTSQQTESVTADSGYDGLSAVNVTVNAMPTGTAGTPVATKGTVSNHSVSITPSVTNTAGYISGETKTGTVVSVSASELDSGTKSINSNGNNQDVVGYEAVDVNVPNSYSSSDEGKVVSNGTLVAQGSDTVTQNGTIDTTLISSLVVNVSGGGSNYVVDINNVISPSSTWSSFDIQNMLSNGGYFEVEFYDPTPTNDYGNIIGFGLRSALSSWSTNTAINFFHYWVSGTTDAIAVRQASTTSYANVDSSSPIKLKIDKDYIYVNDVAIVATASQIKNQTTVTFGSMQGSKRFAGTFNSIKAL